MNINTAPKVLRLCTLMFLYHLAVAYADSNLLFQTVQYADLSSRSVSDLNELLGQLEERYKQTFVQVSRGDLLFLSDEERARWEHDNLVQKILDLRMSLFVNEKVRSTLQSNRTNSTSDLLSEIFDGKTNAQQGGSAYPPQGVGSADP